VVVGGVAVPERFAPVLEKVPVGPAGEEIFPEGVMMPDAPDPPDPPPAPPPYPPELEPLVGKG